jgi:hypothetical protein
LGHVAVVVPLQDQDKDLLTSASWRMKVADIA